MRLLKFSVLFFIGSLESVSAFLRTFSHPTRLQHQSLGNGKALFKTTTCISMVSGRGDATASQFDVLLNEKRTRECVRLLRGKGSSWSDKAESVPLDREQAARLLSQVADATLSAAMPATSDDVNRGPTKEEDDLSFVYEELHRRGLLKGFGYVSMDVVPFIEKDVSPAKLEELIELEITALAPGSKDNAWLYAGVALCVAEAAVSTAMGLDPIQGVIPLTLGLVAFDRLVLRGAAFETLARILVPGYYDKIVMHEAGHFLLAYLLGCPVSGCLLDPWKIREFVALGQGGTVFTDPNFSEGLQAGKLTRSAVDRFSIVLMGGIGAEASSFGRAEGGVVDEAALINILSTIKPPFNYEQIRTQARWAAVQAVLLIREHQNAYDALVKNLRAGKGLGECVMALDAELGDLSALPAEQRRKKLELAAGVTDGGMGVEVRKALEARFAAADAAKQLQQVRTNVADALAAVLERAKTGSDVPTDSPDAGVPAGENANGGGVWVRGLEAIMVDEQMAQEARAKEEKKIPTEEEEAANIQKIEDRIKEIDERLQQIATATSR